jgi:RNA polymerase sigma factor (sigma-70 family)
MKASYEKKRLSEFFRTEYRKLLGFVRRRFDEIAAQDAEDVVHDVAVRLFDRADVAAPVEHLSAYVYQSLHNRMTDYMRSRGKLLPLQGHVPEGEALDFHPEYEQREGYPDSQLTKMEMVHDLYQVMDGLTEEEKNLIIATEILGQSFSHLSKVWNTPMNTLLSRKSRALAKIRKKYQREHHEKEKPYESHGIDPTKRR